MKLYRSVLAAVFVSLLPVQQAFSANIEEVYVDVIDTGGSTSDLLLKKMATSMQVVCEQLFLDKESVAVESSRGEYSRLLAEIGDRVFTGYELKNVEFDAGRVLRVRMYAKPWSSVIVSPVIDLKFSGIDDATAAELESRLPSLRCELTKAINGASVDAGDWAGGVLRRLVRERVEESLPEFKAAVDVLQYDGGATTVQVIIFPVGQLVRNIKYELRSDDIPNILLMKLKYKYISECEKLRGMPVEYVKANRNVLEKQLTEKLLRERELQIYALKPTVTLEPGADLTVNIVLHSSDYRIWFEGYGDIGRKENNLSGTAHIGKFISGRNELFAEGELVFDDVRWQGSVGMNHHWGRSKWSYRYRMPARENVYRLEYELGPKWKLRAEHYSEQNRNEFAVRYRIHEFLSTEYVYGGKEFYLRVIGNL
ncbi:MAG: hypothetical protein SPI71_01980 [Acidaminococcaceae bacterium]|nr:hypothetical protein [Acidaminococcaceae bacterium]